MAGFPIGIPRRMVPALAALLTDAPTQPPELGLVHWRRGYDEAQSAAREADKPVLVLFDEVPG